MMVRETRHLWIGNLPENVREEQIRDLFQRHGRVQSVKFLGEERGGGIGKNGGATVAFIDVRSATKALRAVHSMAGQPLHIQYHEPGSVVGGGRTSVSSGSSAVVHNNVVGSECGVGVGLLVSGSSPGGDSLPGSSSGANNGSECSGVLTNNNSNNNNNNNSTGTAAGGVSSGGVLASVVVPGNNIINNINNNNNGSSGSNSGNNNNSSNGPTTPGAGSGGVYRQRFNVQLGQSEDSSSHFYEQPKSFSRGRGGDGHGNFIGGRGRREHRHGYHRERHNNFNVDRNFRVWNYPPSEGRFAPPVELEERGGGPGSSLHASPNDSSTNSSCKVTRRPDSPASSVSSRQLHSKRHKSRSVSESGSSERGSSDRGSRSRSGSRSSASDRSSVSSGRSRSPPHHNSSGATGHYNTGSSRGGSPGRFHGNSYSRQSRYRSRGVIGRLNDSARFRHSSRSPHLPVSRSSSESSSPSPHRRLSGGPHSPSQSPSSVKSYSPSRSSGTQAGHHHGHHPKRQLNSSEVQAAIRIRNLPIRSSDTSLKDGLYHEYKKHGKVSWVRVIGTGSERYAIVCFKSAEHANRAVESSQDKQFFGCKIQVSRYSRGDEALGVNDEDSRGFSEDELSSVSVATRTVRVTGLDGSITPAELRAAFEQLGDIVSLDIRTQGASPVATCEFMDFASAIKAQWRGRSAFKSKEARVNFVRTTPTSVVLLDGTAEALNEKLITGRCSQYGAISRVTPDVDRNMMLVHFEEISCAQTAVREIKNSNAKGNTKIRADFASPDYVRLFIDRASDSSSRTPPDTVSTNSHRDSFSELTNVKEVSRRSRKNAADLDFSLGKPMTHIRLLDESDSPESGSGRCPLRAADSKSGVGLRLADDDNSVCSGATYRTGEVYSSSLSPDPDSVARSSSDHCKIDLNCHETDSAIVTSSSDIINPDPDAHEHHDDGPLMNGGLSRGRVRCSISKSSSVAVAVDSVSSTSPEPKVETVRKASPDPGIGLPEISSKNGDTHVITSGLADPRRKPSDTKIRRSSADSGSNTTTSTLYTNGSEVGDESDDRPGTPLCDENPESFFGNDSVSVSDKVSARQCVNSSKQDQPLSLPLPSFARNAHASGGCAQISRNHSHSVSSEKMIGGKEFSRIEYHRRSSETVVMKSPIKSPQYEGSGPPTWNSITVECDRVSPPPVSYSVHNGKERISSGKSTNSKIHTWNESTDYDSATNARVENPIVSSYSGGRVPASRSSSIESIDEVESPGNVVVEGGNENLSGRCLVEVHERKTKGSSSDSECSGSSPRRSPTTDKSLDERLQLFHDQYNQWEGNRSCARASAPSVAPPNPIHRSATSLQEGICRSNSVSSVVSGGSTTPTTPAEKDSSETCMSRLARMKHKVLDLDELRHQPSDISKAVLARKSVFDEDIKRLENFGEKYEAKGTPPIPPGNWRMALGKPASSPASACSSPVSSIVGVPPPLTIPASPSPSSSSTSSSVFPSPTGLTPKHAHHHQPHGPFSAGAVKHPKDFNYNNASWNRSLEKPSLPATPTSTKPFHGISVKPESQKGLLTPITTNGLKFSGFQDNVLPNGAKKEHPTVKPECIVSTQPSAGTPRTERSLSLDGRKAVSGPALPVTSGTVSSTSSLGGSPVLPVVSSTTAVATPGHRRISADSHSAIEKDSKDSTTMKKMIEPIEKKVPVKETMVPVIKPQVASEKTVALAKDEIPVKSIDIIKSEAPVANHSTETTVAVIALQNTSVSVPKEPKKENTESKKSRGPSGTSTPLSPSTPSNLTGNASGRPSDSPTVSSSKEKSSSGKDKESKEYKKDKEKDVKKSSSEESIGHSSKSRFDDKTKRERPHHGSESNRDSRDTKDKDRRDKEKESNKLKRRMSSQEREPAEIKKIKIEKKESRDPNPETTTSNSSSSKLKHSNSTSTGSSDRKDSRDLTSSSSRDKEKSSRDHKESNSKDGRSTDGKDKDHHHKSKSSSSSSSKHYHSSDKKSDGHSSHAKISSSSSKDSKSKDKSSSTSSSSGLKEPSTSSKSKSSGSSSSSHTHHGSSNSRKDSRSESSKGSSKLSSSGSKDKDSRSKEKPIVDSDDDQETGLGFAKESEKVAKDKSKERSSGDKDKHEKRDDSVKRDRHKSGDSSSAPTSAESKKIKKQEKKKARRFVVEETDSSDSDKSEDDEDKQKHHSIFEVVIDEYPSMYDKVKARSNRACKNNTAERQKEELRKQEKLEKQFQALKQSRQRREEKKRSMSVEEQKPNMDTSSEDEMMVRNIDSDTSSRNVKREKSEDRHLASRMHETSDDDDDDIDENRSHKLSSKSSKSKSKRGKIKSSSSKHKTKRSGKSSPSGPSAFSNAPYAFTSDDDEPQVHSPPMKKRKTKESAIDVDIKSIDGDSASDYDDTSVIISNVTKNALPLKSKVGSMISSSKLKKRMTEIYTDSDSSARSNIRRSGTPSKSKSREKSLSKQPSVDLKKLFGEETSDSSGDESSSVRRSKEATDDFGKKNRERGGSRDRTGRKKSLSSSGTSSKGSSRRRVSSGETVATDHSSNTKDRIPGAMTPTSGSDVDEKPLLEERPKTPTPLIIPAQPSKPYDETPVSSKPKSKYGRSDRMSFTLEGSNEDPSTFFEDGGMEATSMGDVSLTSKSSERKKKRHKEKRSKTSGSRETSILSHPSIAEDTSNLEDVTVKTETDVDSLFNPPSPQTSPPNAGFMLPGGKQPESTSLSVDVSSNMFGTPVSQRSPAIEAMRISEKTKDYPGIDDSGSKSMFSTDEDEDDLKIDITAAINQADQADESEVAVKVQDEEPERMTEEEVKKIHCSEQDKAIESIVLMVPRVSPSAEGINEEEVAKDEIPEDEVAISQAETEDAVAALLETLEDDGKSENEEEPLAVKTSPSAIRIVVEAPASIEEMDIEASSQKEIEEDKQPDWSSGKSPKLIPGEEAMMQPKVELPSPTPIGSLSPLKQEFYGAQPQAKRPSTDASNSGDVYDFTDSDDEKADESHPQPLAHTKPATGQAAVVKSPSATPLAVQADIKELVVSVPSVDTAIVKTEISPGTISRVSPVSSVVLKVSPGIPALSKVSPGLATASKISPASLGGPKISPVIAQTASMNETPPTTVVTTVSSPVSVAFTPTPTIQASNRTTVDDTIDEVIRMAQNNTLSDIIVGARTSTPSSRSRSRSRSKETPEETATAPSATLKVPIEIAVTRRQDRAEIVPSTVISPIVISTTEYSGPLKKEALRETEESLLDPQTGLLTPVRRESGEFVPTGLETSKIIVTPSAGLRQEIYSQNLDGRHTLEKPIMTHLGPRPEGLPAMLASGGVQKPTVIQQQTPQLAIGQKGVIHGPKTIITSSGSSLAAKAGFLPGQVLGLPASSVSSAIPVYAGKATITPTQGAYPAPKSAQQLSSSPPTGNPSFVTTVVRPVEMPSGVQRVPPPSNKANYPTQVVRIPEVPITTQVTITKVLAEEPRKSAIVQNLGPISNHGNVIITPTNHGSPSTSMANHVSRPAILQVPALHSTSAMQVGEQVRVGCIVNKEEILPTMGRMSEQYIQPPRIDVNPTVAMSSTTPSPKSRTPAADGSQPTHQARYPTHTITFESPMADVRSYTRQPTTSPHYPLNSSPQIYNHYPPGTNIAHGSGPQFPNTRVIADKMGPVPKHTELLHKGGATLTLVTNDRSMPQPMHVVPHMSSPQGMEPTGADSPMLTNAYNPRMYASPIQAHHQQLRPTYTNPYAELEDRSSANSPYYQHQQFDPRIVPTQERELPPREASPYPSNLIARRVVSPPPAHSRWPGMQEGGSPPERIRPPLIPSPGPQLQGDSLLMLLQRYPIMWQGLLALKNDSAACQMHFVSGSLNVARDSLPTPSDGSIPKLQISQRMRLEQINLNGVANKMQIDGEYCMLLALPCGRDHMDVLQQSNNLRTGFITYLQLKQAAGIVNIMQPYTQNTAYVIHIFPSCDFANHRLADIAPDLLNGVADIAHLLIIIATV